MMFFVWLIFLMVIGEFFYILIFTQEEPERFDKRIKKERKFIRNMVTFDVTKR